MSFYIKNKGIVDSLIGGIILLVSGGIIRKLCKFLLKNNENNEQIVFRKNEHYHSLSKELKKAEKDYDKARKKNIKNQYKIKNLKNEVNRLAEEKARYENIVLSAFREIKLQDYSTPPFPAGENTYLIGKV